MSAYLVADISVTDPESLAEYQQKVPAVVEKYGGRYIARGGAVETKEGGWQPQRLVIVEFDDMDAARTFYESEDYAPLLKIRLAATDSRLVMVEGL